MRVDNFAVSLENVLVSESLAARSTLEKTLGKVGCAHMHPQVGSGSEGLSTTDFRTDAL